MTSEASTIPECPIHPGCPIVGGRCSCGEDWVGITDEVQQALRLGLLVDDPFVTDLLRAEDAMPAFEEAVTACVRNNDGPGAQLAALRKRAPRSVAAYEARRTAGAPLPILRLRDALEIDRTASWMNAPGRRPALSVDASIADCVMLFHRGSPILRIPTPEEEQRGLPQRR